MATLDTKKVAFLATNGFEDSELTSPWQAVTDAGATAVMVSPESGKITGKNGHSRERSSNSTSRSARSATRHGSSSRLTSSTAAG
jgi:protease I